MLLNFYLLEFETCNRIPGTSHGFAYAIEQKPILTHAPK